MDAGEQKATLYDFAYIDQERVKSLYAQLFSGLSVSSQKSTQMNDSRGGEAGLNAIIAARGLYASSVSAGSNDTYEPHDLVYLDLVKELADRGYLKNNPSAYHAGDIILSSGILSLVNYDAMSPVMGLLAEASRQYMSRKERRAAEKNKQPSTLAGELASRVSPGQENTAEIMDVALKMVPMTIQIYFDIPGQAGLWGIFDGNKSREHIANIMLKHGPTFPGTWHMLSIVDAIDDTEKDSSCIPEFVRNISEMTKRVRPIFGRPIGMVGVTPLLIFRKISE